MIKEGSVWLGWLEEAIRRPRDVDVVYTELGRKLNEKAAKLTVKLERAAYYTYKRL